MSTCSGTPPTATKGGQCKELPHPDPLPEGEGTLSEESCRKRQSTASTCTTSPTASGPAMVFAHGRGGNHMSWWQQVARFSGDYRCITFDHRGWGQSLAPFGSPVAGKLHGGLEGAPGPPWHPGDFPGSAVDGRLLLLGVRLGQPGAHAGAGLGRHHRGRGESGRSGGAASGHSAARRPGPFAGRWLYRAATGADLPLPADRRTEPGARRGRRDLRLPPRGRARAKRRS